MTCKVIILAAGVGSRMNTPSTNKVLHKVCGTEMVKIVCQKALQIASPEDVIVVVGDHNQQQVRQVLSDFTEVKYALQEEQIGTADGVKCGLNGLGNVASDDAIIVLYGDTPLITDKILQNTLHILRSYDIGLLAFHNPDKNVRYGRVISDGSCVTDIVEFKDASDSIKEVTLCNSGIFGFRGGALNDLIGKVMPSPVTGEYYLTAIPKLAQSKYRVTYIECDEADVLGVNDLVELENANQVMQNRLRQFHMKNGVVLEDAKSVFFSFETVIGSGSVVEPNVIFRGRVEIGSSCTVKASSYLQNCKFGANCSIGPFARIRDGTVVQDGCSVGNFAELKNAKVDSGSKMSHVSYLGDVEIGKNVNIGAGTVVCNYDGSLKHKSHIEDEVFIGSNSSLVSPVSCGEGSFVAAGSVITHDIQSDEIGFGRARQVNKPKKSG